MLKKGLSNNKIEFRPLVAGNLLKQPFLKNYQFSYYKSAYNADIIHELGMYVGNSQFVNEKHIKVLSDIIQKVAINVAN